MNDERIQLREVLLGELEPGPDRPVVERDHGGLAPQLLEDRLLHLGHVDVEELGQHAVIDHVADAAAQLGLRGHGGHQPVERHWIEHQVVTQRVEPERLVIHDRRARPERHHVFACRLLIHRHQEIDLFLASDIPVLVGSDGVPGWKARDIRGEEVLGRHRHAHLKDGAQQDEVGGLAPRPVDRSYLDAKVVDDQVG